MKTSLRITAVVVFVSMSLSGAALSQRNSGADLLVINAHILTMNPGQPVAEALAVKGGRIVFVGSTTDARTQFAGAAQTIDAAGKTVLPGIIDAHGHLMSLGESFLKLDLRGVETPEEVARRVKEKANN